MRGRLIHVCTCWRSCVGSGEVAAVRAPVFEVNGGLCEWVHFLSACECWCSVCRRQLCIRLCVRSPCAPHKRRAAFSFCSRLMASLAELFRWQPRCHGNASCLRELEVLHSLSQHSSVPFSHSSLSLARSVSPSPFVFFT